MSIDMYVSKSNTQATSTSQVCQQHLEGYEALQQAISQFTLEPFLKGKAYDSAKAYYSTVLYPLVQGGILLTEATEEAVKKFPERYQSEVDSGDLKQSELEEQIRRVNELIHQTNDLENQVRQSPLSETDQQIQLQLNQALLEAYQTSKQELEEKLQKLIAFHTSSPSIFSEIARLKQAIDQGLAQTKTAWNPTSGTFMIPSQEKLAWANTIRAFQKKKEAQEEPDTTGRTYTRIDLGNGTYVWAWSKDGRTLTQDDIQFTVKHDTWAGKDGGLGKMLAQAEAMKAEAKDFDPVKAMKEIADLLTPLGDGIRVVTGQDPITGEKLSGSERGLSLIYIIPLAKVGKYGVKGFKFVAEGMEDINKLNKKADKVKEAEKSTKKASGAGTEIGKYSVETLNRDQARTVVENLLDNGEISLKDLQNMVPEGIPNTFKPTDTIKNGAKYEFQLSDGQKAIIRWHEPDPAAAAKFPNSASGSSWTAQIKIGNKQVTVDGLWTKKQNSNEVHVPIQGR
ncbi:pre-toxin TG domain-containing protein [Listeria seeligeri]|uniref:pre-toxin TG domain-containing protein n=2 Tax=Listeria seeligeri TaxID=1640 RepID=UPI0017C80C1F|nr:pre-toxin TG domain-containing protein [Listeria seeligeri]MBC1729064.1 hypothetical protein [Listeria seeligeri]MBC1848580.1 hypothetical protein [Listeria seeligeri]MBC1854157.1 hypothetical protein [Listeria seeligeri]MBC1871113.1 hypothetical protein [Listeria seeligeri]MBC2222835.1 hypothetical protein [Listeria seeligeri]